METPQIVNELHENTLQKLYEAKDSIPTFQSVYTRMVYDRVSVKFNDLIQSISEYYSDIAVKYRLNSM